MKGRIRKSTIRFISFAVFTAAFLSVFAVGGSGQNVVDKTVATVSDGVRTELITYSDLMWQLALQPGVSLAPARSEDLNAALALLVNQRIFALEAERIPRPAPTDPAIQAEIKRILGIFPSISEFERRLRLVGFDSVKDDNFERLIAKRISIENYIDFRFRSFIVNTPEEQTKYYNETFVPDFRRRYPGLLMPTLDEKRSEIDSVAIELSIARKR